MTALLIVLTLLCGGTSYEAVKEHKALKTAHSAAIAAQTEAQAVQTSLEALKAAESKQTAAQAAEDAARAKSEAAKAKQGQVVQVYIGAAGHALEQTPPAVDTAKEFTSLAGAAGDTPTAETLAQAQALADAKAAAQASLIAELQKELADAKGTVAAQAVVIDTEHKANLDAATKIGTLTGDVAVHAEKEGQLVSQVATVTAESKAWYDKYLLKAAEITKWIVGVVILVAVCAVIIHLHLALRVKHAAELVAHAKTKTALAAKTAAHDALQTVVQKLNPPSP